MEMDLSRFLGQKDVLHPWMVLDFFEGWPIRWSQGQAPLNEMLTLCRNKINMVMHDSTCFCNVKAFPEVWGLGDLGAFSNSDLNGKVLSRFTSLLSALKRKKTPLLNLWFFKLQ